MQNNKMKITAVAVLTASLLGACGTTATGDNADTSSQESQATSETNVVSTTVSSDITEAVEKVGDSVVTVINLQSPNLEDYGGFGLWGGLPSQGDDKDEESSSDLTQAGTGSGVVYKTADGKAYIVTNNHVVEGSDALTIQFADGTTADAELIGTDVWTDLAVLSVPDDKVTTVAEFGDSEALTVGETAIAIGSPLGTDYSSSVTAGIISGKDRSVPVDIDSDGVADWETQVLQTDAAINPGNSGGALVNISGQVVGINSMKIATEGVEGIGFAIPSKDVMEIVAQLEEKGEVVRPFLGISLLDLAYVSEEQQADVLNLPEDVEGGVIVRSVQTGSPADAGGLKENDVIVSFNGQEVTTSINLRKAIYAAKIGDKVKVEFYRNGKRQTATITMQEQNEVTQ